MAHINKTIFWVLILIQALALASVLITMISISRYANNIDKLEEMEKYVSKKEQELNKLITEYNKFLTKTL